MLFLVLQGRKGAEEGGQVRSGLPGESLLACEQNSCKLQMIVCGFCVSAGPFLRAPGISPCPVGDQLWA